MSLKLKRGLESSVPTDYAPFAIFSFDMNCHRFSSFVPVRRVRIRSRDGTWQALRRLQFELFVQLSNFFVLYP